MRNTPQTREFLEEEILPLVEDVISSLLDDPSALEKDGAFNYDMASETRSVSITVRLFKPDAARVIGKEHATRQSLYHLFSAIFKNHGFELHSLNILGLQEDGTTATTATTTMQSMRDDRWRSKPGYDNRDYGGPRNPRPKVVYRGQERA